jgi:hypothetical protein
VDEFVIAERNVVPSSRRLHDRANRIHNDLWLIDGDEVTGSLSDDLAAAFRQANLIAL